jgi:F-type H+-transporting ATPase subunit delta
VASEDPISQSMAGRYANALFELAREQGQLPQVEADIKSFEAMLAGSEDLRRLVKSPVFSADDQGRAIGAVLAKSGMSGLTTNFFKLIARNRRLFATPDMIKAFRTILARHRGEVTAEVA